jgi:hypothetical protein
VYRHHHHHHYVSVSLLNWVYGMLETRQVREAKQD